MEGNAFCNWASGKPLVPVHSGKEDVAFCSWDNGAMSSATGVRISTPSGVCGVGPGKTTLVKVIKIVYRAEAPRTYRSIPIEESWRLICF